MFRHLAYSLGPDCGLRKGLFDPKAQTGVARTAEAGAPFALTGLLDSTTKVWDLVKLLSP